MTKFSHIFYGVCMSFLFTLPLSLQIVQKTAAKPETGDGMSVQGAMKGVVVENVAKNPAAQKTHLQPGDQLLRWSRGNDQGILQSPFDLMWLEIEERPKGPVTVAGFRGSSDQTWVLGPEDWGIEVRPDLPSSLLEIYEQGVREAAQGNATQMFSSWRNAISNNDTFKSPAWIAPWFYLRAGALLASAKQQQESDEAYQLALQSAESAETIVSVQILGLWAQSSAQRYDWAGAAKCYQQAIEELRKSGPDNLVVALYLNRLGNISDSRGDLDNFEKYNLEALAIRQKLAPESLEVAGSLSDLGNLHDERGDVTVAIGYYQRALAIKEKLIPETASTAKTINNLGNSFSEIGELDKAEECLKHALTLKKIVAPQSLSLATTLNNLGNVAYERHDLDTAERYYSEALAIREKLAQGSPDVALTLSSLGNVAYDRDNRSRAADLYRQALSIDERIAPESPEVAGDLTNLALVEKDRGKVESDYRRALGIMEKAAPDSPYTATILLNMCVFAYGANDFDQSELYCRRSLSIEEKLGPSSIRHAEVLATLAKISFKKNQPAEAARLFEQALRTVDDEAAHLGGTNEGRSRFRASHVNDDLAYIQLLMEQRNLERAFQVAEHSRAQTLREMLISAHINIHTGIDPQLLEQEKVIRKSLASKSTRRVQLSMNSQHSAKELVAIDNEIEELQQQYGSIEARIRSSSPGYAALFRAQTLNIRDVQQWLDPQTLVLEYALGRQHSYVWVVGKNFLTGYQLSDRATIEGLVRQILKLTKVRERSNKGETALEREARFTRAEAGCQKARSRLSHTILGPVATLLRSKKRLVIVPDGGLWYLPFEELPLPNHSNVVADPLVLTHEFAYLPSLSVLSILRQSTRSTKAPGIVAILADPVFEVHDARLRQKAARGTAVGSTQKIPANTSSYPSTEAMKESDSRTNHAGYLNRLPFSRQEALTIAAVVPKNEVLQALDFQASKALATDPKLANYRIVHFATHGLLNSVRPEFSGLVFSLFNKEGNRQDGVLGLEDIYNMNLPVDLVVLSACETGLGEEIQGEGLIGLTRGFMYAGAHAVIASLWRVDDSATAELMKHFYTAMLHDHLYPVAALQKAKIQMLQDSRWHSPYYWAGFVIQGDSYSSVFSGTDLGSSITSAKAHS